jgi:beta-glucosidase/6-phospho-beta-glucosidase/beta-galactosidase
MKEMRCGGDPVSLRADWFTGPLMAGFECTSYRRRDGVRLDVQASTRHDRLAEQDYKLVSRHGMRCVRDGIVWHRIERLRGCYDWSHLDRMVDGAEKSGVRVMWDFLHFGWPDWTHPLERSFVERFAEFSARAVDRISPHDSVVPINEISFLAWAAGDEGFMHPHFVGQGDDMKRALCAAFIASAKAIRTAVPTMPIMCAEPLIAVIAEGPEHLGGADAAHEAQFQALDIILGRKSPYLGGSEDLIDVVGVNHYPHSQWLHPSRMPASQPIPLSDMLVDMKDRYARPLFLAETGCEGEDRPIWFTYAAKQLETANRAGADVRALCLYPILNHLGWEDDRYCPNGLFCGVGGDRVIYRPLADAIAQWRTRQRPTELPLTHAVIDA